ncbi:MAG: hypothetical protein ACK4IC_00585 [Erythrobacter sp.]
MVARALRARAALELLAKRRESVAGIKKAPVFRGFRENWQNLVAGAEKLDAPSPDALENVHNDLLWCDTKIGLNTKLTLINR